VGLQPDFRRPQSRKLPSLNVVLGHTQQALSRFQAHSSVASQNSIRDIFRRFGNTPLYGCWVPFCSRPAHGAAASPSWPSVEFRLILSTRVNRTQPSSNRILTLPNDDLPSDDPQNVDLDHSSWGAKNRRSPPTEEKLSCSPPRHRGAATALMSAVTHRQTELRGDLPPRRRENMLVANGAKGIGCAKSLQDFDDPTAILALPQQAGQRRRL
jgi:hypothetical protein